MYYHNSTCIRVIGIASWNNKQSGAGPSPEGIPLHEQGQVSEAADDRMEVGPEQEQELWVFSTGAIGGGFTEIPLQVWIWVL